MACEARCRRRSLSRRARAPRSFSFSLLRSRARVSLPRPRRLADTRSPRGGRTAAYSTTRPRTFAAARAPPLRSGSLPSGHLLLLLLRLRYWLLLRFIRGRATRRASAKVVFPPSSRSRRVSSTSTIRGCWCLPSTSRPFSITIQWANPSAVESGPTISTSVRLARGDNRDLGVSPAELSAAVACHSRLLRWGGGLALRLHRALVCMRSC